MTFGNDALMRFISRYSSYHSLIHAIDSNTQFAGPLHKDLHALIAAF